MGDVLKWHLKLKQNMKAKNKNLMTLEEFKEKNYGKRGTKERDELEAGYEAFKIGALIHDTRVEMGMTQELDSHHIRLYVA